MKPYNGLTACLTVILLLPVSVVWVLCTCVCLFLHFSVYIIGVSPGTLVKVREQCAR